MLETSALLLIYRQALAEAQLHALSSEESLYALHVQESERLARLLKSGAGSDAVADLIGRERRSFGWTYLSGVYGERVERAFNELASRLEEQCT